MATAADLTSRIEAVLARPDATRVDLERFCASARDRRIYGVCVNGSRVELARALLEDTALKITALVSFPLGVADSDTKRFETESAIDLGAHEIEVVINIGRLKDNDHRYVLRELRDIAEAGDERCVKAVFEMSLLTPEEQKAACEMVIDSGAQFITTGTGLVARPAPAQIQSLRQALGPKFGIKATGISDLQQASELVSAGATRLGIDAAVLTRIPLVSPPSGSPT